MKIEIEKSSFLRKIIVIMIVIQGLITSVLIGLSVYYQTSLISVNYKQVSWLFYVLMLLVQCLLSMLLLKSMMKDVKKWKAWAIWLSGNVLDNKSIIVGYGIRVHSNVNLYSGLFLISGLLLIIITHLYIRKRKPYGYPN